MSNDTQNENNYILSTDLKPGYDTAEPTQTEKYKTIKRVIGVAAEVIFLLLVIL